MYLHHVFFSLGSFHLDFCLSGNRDPRVTAAFVKHDTLPLNHSPPVVRARSPLDYTTLKTGSINCHVFCILLSGNTITYQSQWPSRAGSPFLPPLQQKGGKTTGSPQKSSTPLPRLVIRPPTAPVSVKLATPFTGKELFEIVQATIKIKLFGQEGGSRGEDERITLGKWDTRQQQTGYVVDYSYQYKNK